MSGTPDWRYECESKKVRVRIRQFFNRFNGFTHFPLGASDWFSSCVKIIVIVHHVGNSAQMSFSSAHTKFSNLGCANAFLTRANEHYAANLRGVNAQLRAQSCPSNQNTKWVNEKDRLFHSPKLVLERSNGRTFFFLHHQLDAERGMKEFQEVKDSPRRGGEACWGGLSLWSIMVSTPRGSSISFACSDTRQ